MTTSTMSHIGAASVPSFSVQKRQAQPALSLRGWIDAFTGALAMARAIPSTGRISASQVAQVRAMAGSV